MASEKIADAYAARTIYFIYSCLQNCVQLLIQVVINWCNSSCRYERLIREKFFKHEISEIISQKFHNQ